MTGSDGFLSRWSRRKQDVAREEQVARTAEQPEKDEKDSAATAAREASGQVARRNETPKQEVESGEQAFDLSKLPPLESIAQGADIRPFLAAGVPSVVRQAALRRFWASDPHVRGIVELAENTGDFTGASELPGFDFSAPSGDLKKMVAELTGKPAADESQGESSREPDRAATTRGPVAQAAHPDVIEPEKHDAADVAGDAAGTSTRGDSGDAQQIAENASSNDAAQNNDATQNENDVMKISRRSHGGAMPK